MFQNILARIFLKFRKTREKGNFVKENNCKMNVYCAYFNALNHISCPRTINMDKLHPLLRSSRVPCGLSGTSRGWLYCRDSSRPFTNLGFGGRVPPHSFPENSSSKCHFSTFNIVKLLLLYHHQNN